jgi:hypothetical protein
VLGPGVLLVKFFLIKFYEKKMDGDSDDFTSLPLDEKLAHKVGL